MSNAPRFRVKTLDRVLICGKTGSGKTYLARHLLGNAPRLICLDPKGRLDDWRLTDADRSTAEGRAALRDLAAGKPSRLRYRLPMDDDTGAAWEDAIGAGFEAGDCVIYIDELYGVVEPGSRAPAILSAAYTRGREYGVGVWSATQRPVWVPLFAISEADHYFCFRLTLAEDRKRMAAFMGPQVEEVISAEHGFFYARAADDAPRFFQSL